MTAQRIAISTLIGFLTLAFLAIMVLGILRETAGTNSYALLADGWLNGRFDTDRCFDTDCALFQGRTYIIFPPLPAAIILPFVALFGVDFHFFMPLSVLVFALSGWLWWRIADHQALAREAAPLLVLLVLFATPLFFVAVRGDRVWFLAQNLGFLFSTAALYFAIVRPRALLVGLFIGMAFLCRQMTILYLPFLYVLLLDRDTPLLRIDMAAVRRALSLAVFPVVALAIYFAYNYARFGSPLETGYAYIFPIEFSDGSPATFLENRVRDLGIFSDRYFLFNLIYMFIAGPHVEFSGRYMTELSGFDVNGASLFLVTPVLLLALLANWDRAFWFGVGTVVLILGLTLFYHSNGFTQYAAQRYALDWLPILLVFLMRGVRPQYVPPLAMLVAYSMMVTLSMIVLGGVLKT
jgi:hypothetical protein